MEMKFTVKNDLGVMESNTLVQQGKVLKMILNKSDQSVIMLMENGDKKTGMKMYSKSFKTDSLMEAHARNAKVTRTGKTKVIEGFTCEQVLVEDDDSNVEAWVTDNASFNPLQFVSAVKGSQKDFSINKMNEAWMKNAVALETTITKIGKEDVIKMLVKDIKRQPVDDTLFSTAGYEIMDMSQMGKGMAQPANGK